MQRTIKVFADPDERLVETIRVYNEAVNDILKVGFDAHVYNKLKLHHLTYYPTREKFGLPASLTTTARDAASEMLKRDKFRTLPVKRRYGAIRYNVRTFRFDRENSIVGFSSIHGRIKIPVSIPEYFRRYLGDEWSFKSALLAFDGGRLIIRLIGECDSPVKRPIENVLGVDTGIYNHAVLSNNRFHNSNHIRAVKGRYHRLRSELQAKGTRSAKRKLRKMAGKERRFMADVNHCVSKWIVKQPEFDSIALETLGIKREKRLGHKFNTSLGKWSYAQLQRFIDYKAEAVGKNVIYIDPRYTSQKCSNCGLIRKRNRNRHEYRCRECGFEIHADLNAARNIASLGISGAGRLFVNQPNATGAVGLHLHSNTSVASPTL